jgi:flagellar motor switch protein FliN/FliY
MTMEGMAINPEELEALVASDSASGSGGGASVTARPVRFAALQPAESMASSTNLGMLLGVTLQVAVELGRTKMSIEEVLKLGPGSVVELDKLAGEPVDVLVNDRLIARGEVVVIEDRFGVRVTDVLPPAQRVDSLR